MEKGEMPVYVNHVKFYFRFEPRQDLPVSVVVLSDENGRIWDTSYFDPRYQFVDDGPCKEYGLKVPDLEPLAKRLEKTNWKNYVQKNYKGNADDPLFCAEIFRREWKQDVNDRLWCVDDDSLKDIIEDAVFN